MSFKDDDGRESVEIKDYNVMIEGRNFFDQSIKNDSKPYDNIRKIATGQGEDYTTGCLLDQPYFKKYYKLIARDFSKQEKLDANPKSIQQINFTGNLDRAESSEMFFIIEEAKGTILDYLNRTVKVLWFYFVLIWYKITQYNMLNVKFSNSHLNRLQFAIKNGAEITLNLSSNFSGSSNDETTFRHKLLLTNTQLSKIRKAFANGQSGG